MLQIVDSQWKDHLYSLDHLKEGIGLRGYGQKRSARRIQEGELRAVPGDEGPHRRGDRPLPVAAHAGHRRRGRRAAGAPVRRRRATPSAAAHAERSVDGRRGVAVRRASAEAAARRAPSPSRRRAASGAHRRRRRRPPGASAKSRRSAATIRVRAAAARNTRSATGPRRATCNVPRAGTSRSGQQRRLLPFVFEE